MTRLLLWLGVACVVLLAAVGGSPVMAAEAQPTTGADEDATLTQADLEIRKAELRVRWAEEKLADAQAEVDAGTADRAAVRDAKRHLDQAKLALLEARLKAQEWESQRVTVELKEATLEDALRLLFKDTPYSCVLSPEIGRLALDPLSIRLKEVDLQTAVRVICDTYDLLYRKEDTIYYFFPRFDVVTVGGRKVPLLGTIEVPHGGAELSFSRSPGPGEVSRSMIVRTASDAASEARTRMLLGKLARFDEPVDLEVKDATLAEVAEKLSLPRPDGAGWMTKIVVHPAVPEDIRVTAQVYGMRRPELVLMLAEQANLDVRVTPTPSEPGAGVVHILPKPQLRVYGTGVGRLLMETPDGQQLWMESSVVDALRDWEAETGESIASFGLRLCPECQQGMMMHWVFCPHCGTKLPCDEEVGAEAK